MIDYAAKMRELGAHGESRRSDPTPAQLAALEAEYDLAHLRFKNLAPWTARYLELRRSATLPPPLSRTPGWYQLGTSFGDFLTRCRRA